MDNKPMIPVDNSGMDEIADELMGKKSEKHEERMVIPEQRMKELEAENQKLRKELESYAPKNAQAKYKPPFWERWYGITLGIGMIVGGCGIVVAGGVRGCSEDYGLDAFSPEKECFEASEKIGLFADRVELKYCADTAQMVIEPGDDDEYIMRMSNKRLDTIITGGKEYKRDSSNEGLFRDAEEKWQDIWGSAGFDEGVRRWGQWKLVEKNNRRQND